MLYLPGVALGAGQVLFLRKPRCKSISPSITGLAALGGSAAFLEILRRWLQRRQDKH